MSDTIGRGEFLLTLFLAILSLIVGVVGALGFLGSGWRTQGWFGFARGIVWLVAWAALAWFITPVRPW